MEYVTTNKNFILSDGSRSEWKKGAITALSECYQYLWILNPQIPHLMDGIQRNKKMSQLCLVHKSILAMNIESTNPLPSGWDTKKQEYKSIMPST